MGMRLAEEPYVSINGEGEYVGNRVIFIRTQGCSVGCSWCDSKFTWQHNAGKLYSDSELNRVVTKLGVGSILWWTGGEPLEAWDDISMYIKAYRRKNLNIMVSAVPMYFDDFFDVIDHLVVDVKLKSARIQYNQIKVIDEYVSNVPDGNTMELKMVVGLDDIEEAMTVAELYEDLPITMQPLYHDEMAVRSMMRDKSEDEFADTFSRPKELSLESWYVKMMDKMGDRFNNVRLLPQLHKMIWPTKMRGV